MKSRYYFYGMRQVIILLAINILCNSQTKIWEQVNFPDSAGINTITTNEAGYIFVGTKINGAFRSIDDGKSWSHIIIDSAKVNINFLMFGPNGILYASTWDHLYKSIDNGNTWIMLKTDPSIKWFNRLAFDVQGNIYCCGATTNAGIIYRSTDNGNSWANILYTSNYGEIVSIAIDSNDKIFIIGKSDILSSSDYGSTWKRLIGITQGYQSYYAKTLAISRDDKIFIGTGGGGVMRSTDSGMHWSWQQNGFSNLYVISLLASRSGILFASTDNGIHVSSNHGDGWYPYFSVIENNPYQLALEERSDGTIFVGTNNGFLYRSLNQTTRFIVNSRFRQNYSGSKGTFVFDSILVKNHSTSSLVISSISINMPNCSVEPKNAIISEGDSIVFKLIASLSSEALFDGSIIFNSNSFLTRDTIFVQLFAGVPVLRFNTRFIDFGNVHRRQSKDMSLELINPGYDTLIVYTEIIPENSFKIFPSSFQIPPQSGFTPTVRFTADTIDNTGIVAYASSQLILRSNSPLTPDIFYLSGASYGLLSVKNMDVMSNKYLLGQNYPNPFNSSTIISFILPTSSFTSIKIFDVLGKEVAILVNDKLSAGTYTQQWDASKMASGVYIYRLFAGAFTESKKLILLR